MNAANGRRKILQECLIHWNFLRVVLPQFKLSISVFLVVNILGSLVIWVEAPGDMTYLHALYTGLALNFFEVPAGYPYNGGLLLQATYFLLPAIGLTVIAEGVVRLGVAIFNRKHLSREWHMALAATFSNHVVIAGLGKIGQRVGVRLQEHEQLVCIEKRESPDVSMLSENVSVIVGDATKPNVLGMARIANARALLALTDNDLANLQVALNAREVNPSIRVVLRMFNEKLGQQLVDKFGFEAVYSMSALAAPSFSAALYGNKILQTIEIGPEQSVHMAKVKVAQSSTLVGQSIHTVEEAAEVSVILHHSHGKQDLLPAAKILISSGDELYVLAELKRLERFDQFAQGASAGPWASA